MRILMIAALLTGLLGCAESEVIQLSNPSCPMMGGDADPQGDIVEWDGKQIGFCCDGCAEKFEALSEDEKVTHLIENGGMDLPAK